MSNHPEDDQDDEDKINPFDVKEGDEVKGDEHSRPAAPDQEEKQGDVPEWDQPESGTKR